jgi:hypothetical protein
MQERNKKILAWRFCGDTLRDGRPIPPDGEVLTHEGELIMCAKGLHASVKIMDALECAPGNNIFRVECAGKIIKSSDKLVCTERKILWRINGESTLRLFARQQALSVAHLWEMPSIVREHLETGKEESRAAAGAAAGAAARAAAGYAAGAEAGKQLVKLVTQEHRRLLKLK